MEKLRGVYFYIWSSEGGSPHLCQLRTTPVGPPVVSIDYVLTHAGYMGPHKLSSFDSHQVGR
jgi:hypothetical protein